RRTIPQSENSSPDSTAVSHIPISIEKSAISSERKFPGVRVRVGRTTRGSQSRRDDERQRIEKTEKPFEKAFQELSAQIPSSEEGVTKINIEIPAKQVSLDALKQTPPSFQKNNTKSPSERNLSTLKSALADVLKEEADKSSKVAIQIVNTPPEVPPVPPPPAPKIPEPEIKKTEVPPERKKEEVKPERREVPKLKDTTKEVPEDILTNILFGED
ncbi:MAG: hypothetical protein PHS95_03195, partial [Candidatus Pacebacteria bacterium]|nr:hypothetical protein [Candidatus Paceibacterota bacterium]